jgi:hypothetical protein
MAEGLAPADEVRARLEEVAAHEAQVLAATPPEARLHG